MKRTRQERMGELGWLAEWAIDLEACFERSTDCVAKSYRILTGGSPDHARHAMGAIGRANADLELAAQEARAAWDQRFDRDVWPKVAAEAGVSLNDRGYKSLARATAWLQVVGILSYVRTENVTWAPRARAEEAHMAEMRAALDAGAAREVVDTVGSAAATLAGGLAYDGKGE